MEWQTLLFSLLGLVLTTLVSWAVERLINFLNLKIKDAKALKYTTDAVEIVTRAVKVTYQTYVEALKDKNMFDGAAQKEALSKAVNQVTTQLPEEIKLYITNNFGDLTEWITTKIESILYDLKR